MEAAMRARRAAETVGDIGNWEALVAKDCVWIEPNGRKTGIAFHRPKAVKAANAISTQVQLTDVVALELSGAGVLTYREDVSSQVGDKTVRTATRFSEVYSWETDHWVLRHSSETPIIERQGVNVDPALFKDYVGDYELAPGMVGIVSLEGGKLTLFSKGWSKPFELVPLSENKFFVRDFETTEITFVRDASGKVTHHTSQTGDQPVLTAKKIR